MLHWRSFRVLWPYLHFLINSVPPPMCEFAYLSDFSEHIWGKIEELTVLSSVGNTKKTRKYTVISEKLKSNQ